MPISVACTCGKTFRVRDDLAGQTVTCQVCGASVQAVAAEESAAPPPPPVVAQALPAAPAGETMACPACAEAIPRNSLRCPYCKERLSSHLTEDQKAAFIQGLKQSMESHAPAMDDDLRGGLMTLKTMVVGGFAFAFVVLFLYGIMARDAQAAGVFGFIFGGIFGIAFLVSLNNDYQAHHIPDASSADQALKRYLTALQNRRSRKAFAAVTPLGRRAKDVESIKFNNPKVAHTPVLSSYGDADGLQKYWKTIFAGPTSTTRSITIKNVQTVRQTPDGLTVVEARLGVTSYSNYLYLTVFLGVLICALLILILQARDEVVVRKVMLKHKGRWYVVDGSISSTIDRAYA
ncbi:MAG: hypothetical protein KIS92_19525 [Planctomycetota bacterium]|nr:hypothetical protein [Planctomycetota bacterium]